MNRSWNWKYRVEGQKFRTLKQAEQHAEMCLTLLLSVNGYKHRTSVKIERLQNGKWRIVGRLVWRTKEGDELDKLEELEGGIA